MTDFKEHLGQTASEIEHVLVSLLSNYISDIEPLNQLQKAMAYSATGGGKRLRPYLCLAVAEIFGAPREKAMRVAAAIEMVHCYSLIHDDLPAMDDSDLRRGRPTVHKVYDDATAVLTGDALLTEAFVILADQQTHEDAEIRSQLVRMIAEAAGVHGMIGGQMMDIYVDPEKMDLKSLKLLHAMKTGAMIRVSCQAGLAIAGQRFDPTNSAYLHIIQYANTIGLAFQIVDDILDATASTQEMGKPSGLDVDNDKMNFVSLVGLEEARNMAATLIGEARLEIVNLGDKGLRLQQVADYILNRTH